METTRTATGEKYLEMVLEHDVHDATLVQNVHPPSWVNPTPAGVYNLVVVGAGTAGLVSAAGAAGLGARVALIERALMGGDCLNVGCVPSKGVIRAARAAHDVRTAGDFGVRTSGEPDVDFAFAMERMRRLRARISPADSAERFKSLGIDVFLGDGRFVGPNTVEVDGAILEFKKAVIATGAKATRLDVPGLDDVGFYTNETIFTLTHRPDRLVVVGGGPIGCELAQSFQRLGSRVTVLEVMSQIMPLEDRDAVEIVQAQMERDGVSILVNTRLVAAERRGAEAVVTVESNGDRETIACDAILVGVGRTPNTEGLGLEAAGVKYGKQGVEVDERLRTSNPRVYAAGDVCHRYKFTHAADAMARIVLVNSFFFGLGGKNRVDDLVMPWATFTDPEIAHVGYYEKDARAAGFDVATITHELSDNDRAILDGEDDGFARVHYDRRTGKILGATVVARHAGEMINELTLAISSGLKMGSLSSTIHPYPTQSEAIKRLGDAYQKTLLTPFKKRLLERWFAWNR